jgi:hypothetical protein
MAYDHLEIEARWGTILGEDNNPLEAVKPWQTSQIQGVVRFRDRLHAVCRQPLVDAMDDATRRLLHKTIKKVTTDIDAMAFNTAVARLAGQAVLKFVYVPGQVVNLVVG